MVIVPDVIGFAAHPIAQLPTRNLEDRLNGDSLEQAKSDQCRRDACRDQRLRAQFAKLELREPHARRAQQHDLAVHERDLSWIVRQDHLALGRNTRNAAVLQLIAVGRMGLRSALLIAAGNAQADDHTVLRCLAVGRRSRATVELMTVGATVFVERRAQPPDDARPWRNSPGVTELRFPIDKLLHLFDVQR